MNQSEQEKNLNNGLPASGSAEDDQGKPAWAAGVQVFTEISTWIVFPIVIALFAGRALDSHFGTKPWIFIGLAFLSFIVTIFGIVRVVKQYSVKLKKNGSK